MVNQNKNDQEIERQKFDSENRSELSARRSNIRVYKLSLGGLIIFLGLWLLGGMFVKLPGANIIAFYWWPVIVFFVGAIISGSSRSMAVPGLMLMLVSCFFLIDRWGIVDVKIFRIIWVGALILIGLFLLVDRRKKVS